MKPFSTFSKQVKPQPMFDILRSARELEKRGQEIVHLEVGDNSIGFDNAILRDSIHTIARNPPLGYCASDGVYELRSKFAEINTTEKGWAFDADNVVISPANSLIYQFLAVTCDQGDTVLLPDPGFPTYYLAAEALGLHVVTYPLVEKNNWCPDADVIRTRLIQHSVKALLINNPSNPLGAAFTGADIFPIFKEAIDTGVHVLMDETYKNLVYDRTDIRTPHIPGITYLYSLSKDAAAPALRISTLVGQKDLIAKVSNFSSLLYSCHSPILQQIALDYLNQEHCFFESIKKEMPSRISDLCEKLESIPIIRFNKPNSAFYLFLNISAVSSNADQFAKDLLAKTGVCVCPGSRFGPTGKNFIRINIGVSQIKLETGIARLTHHLSEVGQKRPFSMEGYNGRI